MLFNERRAFVLEGPHFLLKLKIYRHWCGNRCMHSPPLDPPVSDNAPSDANSTR
jgi:hypothetical protein